VLPWEAPRVRLFLSHWRKSLFYRKRAWRFIAPRPHALRLVSKWQWSGTLRQAPAKARARHKSRQSLEDRRFITWQWRFDTPPKPPNTVPPGGSFLEILLLATRYGKTEWFSKFIGIGSTSSAPHLFLPPEKFPNAILGSALSAPLEDTATAILGSTLSAPFDGTRLHWKHCECSLGKHLESTCSDPTGEIPILQEASALLGSTSSSLCLFFSHRRHFVLSSALGRHRNCYPRKYLECSL